MILDEAKTQDIQSEGTGQLSNNNLADASGK